MFKTYTKMTTAFRSRLYWLGYEAAQEASRSGAMLGRLDLGACAAMTREGFDVETATLRQLQMGETSYRAGVAAAQAQGYPAILAG